MPTGPASTWTYEQTLKDADVEERVNYRLHRPLAFQIIKPFEHWRWHPSPNQITMISATIGILSGVAAWMSLSGGRYWFAVCAAMLFVSVVLDCCDGMLSRLTGTSSEFGMILDGAMDFFVANAVGIGLGLATLPYVNSDYGVWLLVAIFPSMFVHATVYDHIKKRFLELVNEPAPNASFDEDEHAGNLAVRFFKGFYELVYINLSKAVTGIDVRDPHPGVDPSRTREILRGPMRLASAMGVGTHFLVLYSAALLGLINPAITFWVPFVMIVGVFNVVMIAVRFSWARGEAKLRAIASQEQ